MRVLFTLLSFAGLTGSAYAKTPLEYLDGLYLGAGLQRITVEDDEPEMPLAFDIRYAPAWSGKFSPYARFTVTSVARPTDEAKENLRDWYGDEFVDELGWRYNALDFNIGAEINTDSSLFVRTGIAGVYESQSDAGPQWRELSERVLGFEDIGFYYTETFRAGLFAAAGTTFELSETVELESSVNLSYLRGLTVAGSDTIISGCDEGEDFGEACDEDKSDLAGSMTNYAIENQINFGVVTAAATVFIGKVSRPTGTVDYSGGRLTVGYEFGGGERETRSSEPKKAPRSGIELTGIKEFDELFIKAKAIQDRVVALRMKLAEGQALLAWSLGASPDTEVSVLAEQAKGSLMNSIRVSTAGGVPSFSAASDASPETQQAAAGLSIMAETAQEATTEMAKLKDEVMVLINDAQAFPGQAPSAAQAALKDGSIKFMEVPKVPKKVAGNVKEMGGLPQEIAGLAADAASTAAVLGSIGR